MRLLNSNMLKQITWATEDTTILAGTALYHVGQLLRIALTINRLSNGNYSSHLFDQFINMDFVMQPKGFENVLGTIDWEAWMV